MAANLWSGDARLRSGRVVGQWGFCADGNIGGRRGDTSAADGGSDQQLPDGTGWCSPYSTGRDWSWYVFIVRKGGSLCPSFENLIKDYGDFKIEIPRWEIPDSGITALWGPSGSGKTSVFRLLIGLESCPGLSWKFGETDLALMDPAARRLGVVFQTLELFPHMTAEENIVFAARARGASAVEAQDRVRDLAEELRITPILSRKALVLSGGEAQRVALARAVVGQPRFLFLDEPFSSLDAQMREEARALVAHVVKRLNVPTLLVTHDQEDLRALGKRWSRLRTGELSRRLYSASGEFQTFCLLALGINEASAAYCEHWLSSDSLKPIMSRHHAEFTVHIRVENTRIVCVDGCQNSEVEKFLERVILKIGNRVSEPV